MGESTPSREQLLLRVRELEARLAESEHGSGASAAKESLEDLGQFASSIAHDLNNLLVGILGNAGLALMDLSSFSSCRPLIREVEEAAQRAAELANQMLAFAGTTITEQRIETPEDKPPAIAWRGEGLMLVVDDEEMIRVLAQRVLEKFGFQVMTAADGRQAIEIFRPHAGEFAAVLLDVTMPHLDGTQTFHELRKLRPDLRVILSSGYLEHDATRRIVDEGLASFLHKPYLPMDLIEKVREALEV